MSWKKAQLILSPRDGGGFKKNIRNVGNSNASYSSHYTEKVLAVRVRPLLTEDIVAIYKKHNIEKSSDEIKKLVIEELVNLSGNVAHAFEQIDGVWHYKLYYEHTINSLGEFQKRLNYLLEEEDWLKMEDNVLLSKHGNKYYIHQKVVGIHFDTDQKVPANSFVNAKLFGLTLGNKQVFAKIDSLDNFLALEIVK